MHISELMLVAADVDRDYFTLNAPEAQGQEGMTLYASSADKALAVSRRVAGGIPRAGDVPPNGPIILPKIDSIDVTAVGRDILGLDHDVRGTRSVMTDIPLLLTEDPKKLPNLRSIVIRRVPENSTPPGDFRSAE